MSDRAVSQYSCAEEIANSVTHGLGMLLSIGGLAVLVGFASVHGNAWHITACSIFGTTLILSYATSTLYHSIPLPGAKRVLKVLDHSAIYLLIAGTYTPFTLVSLRGPWGWSLFGTVWGLALLGIILKATMLGRIAGISTAVYLAMGWIVLIAIKPMLGAVDTGGLLLLLAGGLAYSGGVVFYLWRRLPYNHAIWHLFVLTGSLCHFFSILFYVIPQH
ncbi:hemolysin III [Malonomonas rubra DSM 5091]|uniref:Hemolysin III n=1 Tax=Malonomonas rubra DSM 5091 TaxID=1122189 RepID=A0A1M6JSJ4_MALRU|nr:hemolysin III family protein [Malonomonas rubra]SHJ49717.1 hemolysin III [Malonomonas rubra DSM 5091]